MSICKIDTANIHVHAHVCLIQYEINVHVCLIRYEINEHECLIRNEINVHACLIRYEINVHDSRRYVHRQKGHLHIPYEIGINFVFILHEKETKITSRTLYASLFFQYKKPCT